MRSQLTSAAVPTIGTAAQQGAAAAFAALAATLAALATQPRTGPPAGYVPCRWHTLGQPPTTPLDHPATDPDRWLGFI